MYVTHLLNQHLTKLVSIQYAPFSLCMKIPPINKTYTTVFATFLGVVTCK